MGEGRLPAALALLGCVLVLTGRRARLPWLGVAAAGAWLVVIVVWLNVWGGGFVGGWHVQVHSLLVDADVLAASLYTALFGLAALVSSGHRATLA